MFNNYIKIAFRNMRKNKTYSFINITGLAIGMASFMLIMLYVQHEISFDNFHEKLDRIYDVVLETSNNQNQTKRRSAITSGPLAPKLKEVYPEVISATRVRRLSGVLLLHQEKKFIENGVYFADSDMFDIFTFQLSAGDATTALQDPFSIVVSASTAQKYFGDDNPIGRTVTYVTPDKSHELTVTGVFENLPANSYLNADIIIPFETYGILRPGSSLDRWNIRSYYTYILLDENGDYKELESKFPDFIENDIGDGLWEAQKQQMNYLLTSFKDLHFRTGVRAELGVKKDIRYIYLFSALALLILLIACINYMNLATAKSVRRSKEVGVRKVVGALKKQLISQFMSESAVFTAISLLLSLTLVYFFLPVFNSLIEREFALTFISSFQFMLGILAVFVFVGLFASLYPAFYISSFKPVSVLKGVFGKSTKGSVFRNTLVVFQFSISIILVVATLVVEKQLYFIRNTDVGYTRDRIVVIEIRDKAILEKIEVVRSEIRRNPNVINVATSGSLPNSIGSSKTIAMPGRRADENNFIYISYIDYDFIDLFEIEMVDGRNFSRENPSDLENGMLINEAAAKAFNWNNPVGKVLEEEKRKVVGVMKDFNMLPLHLNVEPLYFYLDPRNDNWATLSIKIRGSAIPQTLSFLQDKLSEFSTTFPFDYRFFDDIFNEVYKSEERIAKIFNSFAFLAVFIACLGLFGLASFTAEQRTKEIGVRKVLGAPISSIITLLSKEFTKWILIAACIGWPVSYYLMISWLESFAYRINLDPGLFLYAGLLITGIALFTVSFQTIRAALTNPVYSLRAE